MKLPISIAEKLLQLQRGERIPASKMRHSVIELMIENGILKKQIQGRSKIQLYISNENLLSAYLKNHFGIDDLIAYIEISKKDDLSRAEAILIASDSKVKAIRTFKGFLVNSFQPINATLNEKPVVIQPNEGTFTFIYDYENFKPSQNVTIVGIENPENFRYIQKQKKIFTDICPLFVSRYPQSKDLIKWLQTIPNNYLHFSDFDFSGLNIYHNEYKKYLQNRATFFLPSNIEYLLSKKGNRSIYNNQKIYFDRNLVQEVNVLTLLQLIEKYKMGLEQEVLINEDI